MQTQYTTERKGSPYEQPVGRAASLKTRGKVDNGLRSQIERGDRVCAFRGLRPLWPHPFGLRPLSFSPPSLFSLLDFEREGGTRRRLERFRESEFHYR